MPIYWSNSSLSRSPSFFYLFYFFAWKLEIFKWEIARITSTAVARPDAVLTSPTQPPNDALCNPSLIFRIFHIKSWPHRETFDPIDKENCIERSIDASLYEGEQIQINLKSAPGRNGEGEGSMDRTNFNLQCAISKVEKRFVIKFPR